MKSVIAVSILVLLAGCGTTTVPDTTGDETVDPYADPPGYTGDPFAGFGPVTSIRFPAEEEPVAEQPADTTGAWSVQVTACGTMDAALSVRDIVANRTDQPVFIDHIGTYYKVRVGSFATSSDTDELRIQLRSGGYPDAWSVKR